MNRRTFMQSLTAAFSVAMTGINFQPVTRYSLGQPFGIDGEDGVHGLPFTGDLIQW